MARFFALLLMLVSSAAVPTILRPMQLDPGAEAAVLGGLLAVIGMLFGFLAHDQPWGWPVAASLAALGSLGLTSFLHREAHDGPPVLWFVLAPVALFLGSAVGRIVIDRWTRALSRPADQ